MKPFRRTPAALVFRSVATGAAHSSSRPGAVAGSAPAASEGDTLGPSSTAGVTWRGLLLGLVGVPITCLVVAWAELKLITLQIGYLQMPPAVIGLLLLFLLVNAGLRALSRRLGLSAQDLTVAYAMMLLASMISSRGLMQKLIPLLVSPNYFADAGNDWQSLYFPRIRQWLVPFDVKGAPKQEVATRFFERLRPGEAIPWNLWIGPLVAWSVLVLLVFGAFLCLAAMLRKQWVDNEKLGFPLVQLPLEMIGSATGQSAAAGEVPLFKSRLMWLGFAIPTAVFLFKGLHVWYPAVPDVLLEIDLGTFLTDPPWNGIFYTPVKLSFAIIGFMFLLPSDLVFSLWFFFVLSRVQDIVVRAANMDAPAMPMYPTPLYRGYQAMGAYLVLTGYLLWVARPHLAKVFRHAVGEERGDDRDELVPYRVAFWGFVVCALGAGFWLTLIGMSPLVAAMQLGGLFFVIGFIMARSTAEAGMLMTESSFRPIDLFRLLAPVHTLGPSNLAGLAFTDSLLLRDQRGLLLSGFLDGLRLGDGTGVSRRRFLPVFVVAILLAVVVAMYIQLRIPYQQGGITLYGYVYNANNKWGLEDYQNKFRTGELPVGWQGPTFLLVGMAVTVLLTWGRANLGWFPFHPLGYALCSSWTMIVFWFSAFVAWLVKSLILRYGGMKLYRQARPFFLGMILGEFFMALFWTIVSAISRGEAPTPAFPWS